MSRFLLCPLLLLGIAAASLWAGENAPTFSKDIQPLLAGNCNSCHGPKKKKGGVDLAVINSDTIAARQRRLWRRVLEQVETGIMPPEEAKPMPAAEREKLVAWLKQAVATVDPAVLAEKNPGRAVVKRLNRDEYNRTVRDLFGIELDVASTVGLPDEGVVTGYDTLANALTIPPALTEKYFAAADKILENIFGGTRSDGTAIEPNKAAHDRLVFVKPNESVTEGAAARQVIATFLRRAYRRPVQDAEIERYMKLYVKAAVGAPAKRFAQGVRTMVKAALLSPHFLLRIEEDRGAKGSAEAYKVSDHELAVRLSYFLWSSLPDTELDKLADEKKLSAPAVFESQVRRMLADPKARALTDSFAAQWLQIKKLDEARPSTEFFPTFTHEMRKDMYEETALFFDHLRLNNASILDLLDSNYSFVNERLAAHYGVPGIKGSAFQKIVFKPDSPRGGLLGMASMLALTSHVSRTSPTLRGKWILDTILGAPPPPPPANVSQIKEEHEAGKEPKSFRELLAQHASDAACMACHKKIDPLGFGLENYDAIGRWRDSHGGQPIDSSGLLPGGQKFKGPRELRQILLGRKDEFVNNVIDQLFTYALGRDIEWYDEGPLQEIKTALHKDGHRFQTLVLAITKSYPFQYRRNTEAVDVKK